MGHTNKLKH